MKPVHPLHVERWLRSRGDQRHAGINHDDRAVLLISAVVALGLAALLAVVAQWRR